MPTLLHDQSKANTTPNTMDALTQRFHRDGYILVPGVLNPDEVQQLRDFLLTIFEDRRAKGLNPHKDNPYKEYRDLLNDIYVQYPPLIKTLLNERTLPIFNAILGKGFVITPECTAMREYFNPLHTDTTEFEMTGWFFHREPDYLQVTAGMYLQDNGPDGGGLYVVPGSHRKPDPCVPIRKKKAEYDASKWQQWLHKLSGRRLYNFQKDLNEHPDGINLPTKAGDLIIFDVRLVHRSSFARPDAPKSSTRLADGGKLAIFSRLIKNDHHVDTQIKWLQSLTHKPSYQYLTQDRDLRELQGLCKPMNVVAL